jgi:hypothetical protein
MYEVMIVQGSYVTERFYNYIIISDPITFGTLPDIR